MNKKIDGLLLLSGVCRQRRKLYSANQLRNPLRGTHSYIALERIHYTTALTLHYSTYTTLPHLHYTTTLTLHYHTYTTLPHLHYTTTLTLHYHTYTTLPHLHYTTTLTLHYYTYTTPHNTTSPRLPHFSDYTFHYFIQKTHLLLPYSRYMLRLYTPLHRSQGVELGPMEVTINSLQKSIVTEQDQTTSLQNMWLRNQNELVTLTKERDCQLSDINNIKKKQTIMEQRKLRIEGWSL